MSKACYEPGASKEEKWDLRFDMVIEIRNWMKDDDDDNWHREHKTRQL